MRINSFTPAGRSLVVRLIPISGEERRQLLVLEAQINALTDSVATKIAINGMTGISIIFKPKTKLP